MTTLLSLLNASIECNNLGVVLLNAGDVENALDSFMTAAKLMHPVSKQVQSFSIEQQYSTSEPGFEIPDGIRRIVQESAGSVAANGTRPTDNIFISAEPIRLDLAQQLPYVCTFESAAVVYNMAIAYHLQGTTPFLHRAIFLFDMAFKLCCPLVDNPKAVTVSMGSLNNAGQIFHSFGEYPTSRRYLDTLRVYIIKLPIAVDPRSMEERHQFLLNAVLLRPPIMASAA